MANNGSSDCNLPNWYPLATDIAFYMAYYAISPSVQFLHIIAILAVIKALLIEARTEKAYWYQIFVAAGELLEKIFGILYMLPIAFVGMTGFERQTPTSRYFRSIYGLMWYKAQLSNFLPNGMWTTVLLLAFCLALDRIYAIAKPFEYKVANHGRRRIICLAACCILGLGTSICDCWIWNLVPVPDSAINGSISYQMVPNFAYGSSTFWNVCNNARNVARFVGWLCLIIANITLLIFHQKLTKKGQEIRSNDDRKAKVAKEKQMVLLILTISHSVARTVTAFLFLIVYLLAAYAPMIFDCGLLLMVPILDTTIAVVPAIDFCIVMIISKTFRKMVLKAIGIKSVAIVGIPTVGPTMAHSAAVTKSAWK